MRFRSLATGSWAYSQPCGSEWHCYLGDIYPNAQADSPHVCPNENSSEDLRQRSLQISDDLSACSALLSSAPSRASQLHWSPQTLSSIASTQGVHCASSGVPSVNDTQQKALEGGANTMIGLVSFVPSHHSLAFTARCPASYTLLFYIVRPLWALSGAGKNPVPASPSWPEAKVLHFYS